MYCEDVRRIADWAKRWPTIPAVLTHTCESIARKGWFGSEEERFALPDEVIELGRSESRQPSLSSLLVVSAEASLQSFWLRSVCAVC